LTNYNQLIIIKKAEGSHSEVNKIISSG